MNNSITYIGENLLPGQLGHAALILAFVAALFSVVSYSRNVYTKDGSWLKMGRAGFGFMSIGILGLIAMLFYVMINRMYEYQYAFAHVSDDLPMRYILSAFWEGQEGSFLLWLFWHSVLGWFIIGKGGRWEAPVIAILSLIQLFLLSMLLGIYIGDIKFGANPTLLTRDALTSPIFAQADYLRQLPAFADGLNPLLQNYWNTIHPPVTFLGFASVSIPFCFALAGLWLRAYREWLRPAFRWALFSGAILGTGILMGSAWAYEALTFGGYWAWDPVENMSLVPWMVMIAGIHTHMIARATGRSLRATVLFYILSFVLILYASFLTRSGILGETSAHAFTEMGLEWQLVGFVGFFAVLGLGMFAAHASSMPEPQGEESITSREFWMFMGSMALIFGAGLITLTTSFPVINKIIESFDPSFEGWALADREEHHNRFQLWVAVLIALLSGTSQFLYYRGWKGNSVFWKRIGIAAAISVAFTLILAQWIEIHSFKYLILLFSAAFAIVTNFLFFIAFAPGKWKATGSMLSHVGFGVMLLGVMASGLNKDYLFNPTVQRAFFETTDDEDQGKSNTLYREKPLYMNGYEVTYVDDSLDGLHRYFEINFKKLDQQGVSTGKSFTLFPHVQYTKDFEDVAAVNPDTRHYPTHDVFTMLDGLPQDMKSPASALEKMDSLNYELYDLRMGDTLYSGDAYARLLPAKGRYHPDYEAEAGDMAVAVALPFRQLGKPKVLDTLYPTLLLRQGQLFQYTASNPELGLHVRLPEQAFTQSIEADTGLTYVTFSLAVDEVYNYGGYDVRLTALDKQTTHAQYVAREGDIALEAVIEISGNALESPIQLRPLYLIRNKEVLNLKAVSPETGLNIRFIHVDLSNKGSERMVFAIAKADASSDQMIAIEMAERVPRSDYIALKTIIFPGMYLLWGGAICMMLGLGISVIARRN